MSEISVSIASPYSQEEYDRQLRDRQRQHLDAVKQRQQMQWQPCAHHGCMQCYGTGIKLDGSMCVHFISCSCPRCTPYCMSTSYNA